MSVGGSSEKGSSKTEPWDQQKPYLIKAFGEADRLYGGNPGSQAQGTGAQMPGVQAGAGGASALPPSARPHGGAQGVYIDPTTNHTYQPNGDGTYTIYAPGGGSIGRTSLPQQAGAGGAGAASPTNAGYGGIVGQFYQGSTVAPMSNTTLSALKRYSDMASGNIDEAIGANSQTMAGRYLDRAWTPENTSNQFFDAFAQGTNEPANLTRATATGSFLNANPHLDQMVRNASKSAIDNYVEMVKPNVDSAFATTGRYGSNAHQTAENRAESNLMDSLARTSADIYGDNYSRERGLMENATGRLGDFMLQGASGLADNFRSDQDRNAEIYDSERNRMMEAIRLAPGLQEASFLGADKAMEAGKYIDNYNQDILDSDIARWDYNQNLPYTALERYMRLISGDYGGTTTSKTKSRSFNIPLL